MPDEAATDSIDVTALVADLQGVLGSKSVSTDSAEIAPLVEDWRGRWTGTTPVLVKPASTAEVAEAVRICAKHGVAVNPQGGNTGLVNGGVPHGEVLISLRRMNRVREIDPLNDAMTLEAGVILADAQRVAEEAGRLFPLSLGSEGVATIGGLISTNAGGVGVLRYGMMRDLVLGLEVVLPDGRIWNGLRALRKDNTGYDLKQLFIGGEGTLGIVTAATLKLFPRPAAKATAWANIRSPEDAVKLLALAKEYTGGQVTGFEIIPAFGLDLVLKHIPDTRDPLPGAAPWRVLLEVSLARREGVRDMMEGLLAAAFEEGMVEDAVIAESDAQSALLWKLRESVPVAERVHGKALKHDVSVPVSRIARFLDEGAALVRQVAPGSELIAFGHVGDGNIHFNVTPPPGEGDAWLESEGRQVTSAIHEYVVSLEGSISAEHGIGRLKRDELPQRKSEVEMDLMRMVKHALDPDGRMNPGRVLRSDD
ncbi:MAG: FAD-binding oxidoreductase [Hyphomonadaceae bacterium]